jgi:predicted dehydrogenase
MSYGPGRYDPDYEEHGHDYPFSYVRWTEQRNIESFLDLVGQKRIDVDKLISHRFPIEDAQRAYQLISGAPNEPYLGVVLKYDPESPLQSRITLTSAAPPRAKKEQRVGVGVVGAGAYLQNILLPQFKTVGVAFRSIATASGVSAHDVGKRFGFAEAVSIADEVINDPAVNLLVIGTRHDLHAELAIKALALNKHVFVEKPLALSEDELSAVVDASINSSAQLMVGYNRRFSPLAKLAKNFFDGRNAPLSIVYRVNAGRIPKDHWIQDPVQGGGRIIGEVCHFVDFIEYITGALPVSVFAESVKGNNALSFNDDSVLVTLRFADGSNGSIAYLGEGDRALAKERVEIFGAGRSFVIDDFRRAIAYKDGREEQTTLRAQDKGQLDEVRAVCESILKADAAPITLEELAVTSLTTFRILDSLRTGQRVDI